MNKLILYITVVLPMLLFKALPVSAAASAAQKITAGLDATNALPNLSTSSPTVIIGKLIQVTLSVTGIVFLIITVYAGVLYLIAAGDADKVKKAKSMLVTSVIGIVIILTAYALAAFVVGQLGEAVTTTTAKA